MKEFFKFIKRFIPPYKLNLVYTFLFNLLSAVFGVFSVVTLKPVLEILFETKNDIYRLQSWAFDKDILFNNFYYYITQIKLDYGVSRALVMVGVVIIVAVFFKVGFAFLASVNTIFVRNGVIRDLRQKLYNKIINLPLPFFSEEKKGDVISRITGDVTEVENSVMTSVDMFLKNPIIILVSLFAMIFISYQLTLFALILLPIAGFIIGRIGKSLKKTSRKAQNKLGEILSIVEETLSGLRIIKAFNAEKIMGNRFGDDIAQYKSTMNKVMIRRSLAHPSSEFLGTAIIVIVLWFGGNLILNDNSSLNASDFIVFLLLFYSIINPSKAFTNAFYNIQKGMAAMDRIDAVLYAQNTITEKKEAESISEFKNEIEYRNVNFSYEKEPVLRDINVKIEKGKTIALVGQSGSGKSTFVDLLPRFWDVHDGGIYIDGINIRDLKLKDLRDMLGIVSQEAILFNDTFFNNIAFGIEDATLEDVISAAKVANANEFIMETENGYDTNIGDRGSKLSGGQRQRISIARAVLKNPPIMILDEATSALDTQSERMVQEALEKLMLNRTSIVIAHRLSTIQKADEICVMHEGRIVERGRHEELLRFKGYYKKLHDMQFN